MKNYDAAWTKVDELVQKKNLPQSALAEVKKIYLQAKKDQQEAQVIKSLVYMIRLQQDTRENNLQQSIKDIESEIRKQKEPTASLLNSLLAGIYWQYFQNNRWQLYGRTNTTGFKKDDIATWTTEDLHKKISDLYLASLKKEQLLKQTSLEPYNAIIIKGNTRKLRPTMYDLLAHRALEYFTNNERSIKKPAYAFEISDPEAFAPAPLFIKHRFVTKDSISLEHKALLIYQDLVAFHLRDKNTEALMDVDIERIRYVYENSVNDAKDSLYKAALENLVSKGEGKNNSAQAAYWLASFYHDKAAQYDPLKDTSHRYDLVKAQQVLEKVVKDSTVKNEGWTNSFNLLQEITKPAFSLEVEKVNLPSQPFRSLVEYKNIARLHFRIIRSTDNLRKLLEQRGDQNVYWNAILKAEAMHSWQQDLPATADLQKHWAEVKIDSLPLGEYILLASPDEQFTKRNSLLGSLLFYVSNISYINQQNQYYVLHRESGKPLAKAKVQAFRQTYDYKTSSYTKTLLGSYETDKNGNFTIPKTEDRKYEAYFLDINYQDDHLALNDQVYNYYNYYNEPVEEDSEAVKVFFFTDRSIYRPGQTVYFKGIAVTKSKAGNSVARNYKTNILLEDANSDDIDSLAVTTNEFGSFSGKFQLPQNSLNGAFRIYDEENDNEVSFSVEEYKRPRFFVEFDKLKNNYKVGDTITVQGNAKAYAGNTIDGARVSYRVVRQSRFIYPWMSYKMWLPPSAPMEIAHGETITDKEGKFLVNFTAIPDSKIDKKAEPLFDYKIYADVTDINGETRSGEKNVTAGYRSLLIKTDMAPRVAVDSFRKLDIRTENMNGEFQATPVTINIAKLIPEKRLIRGRLWREPDQFVMSREQFVQYFPHDEYKNETDYKNWPKESLVFTINDSTNQTGILPLYHPFTPGYYEVSITTKEKNGEEIKLVQYVELFEPNSKDFNKPVYLWTKGSDHPIEPGESTNVQVGSSANDVFLINEVRKPANDNRKQDVSVDYTILNQEKKNWKYTASESDRGGYGVSYFFVKDNRFYQFNDIINIPWTNKDLKVEYATFRDKTLPGSEEKWKVKISGYKKETVAAEMLASMYDASLDQFKPHQWSIPGIWPVYANLYSWSGRENFVGIESEERWQENGNYKEFNKTYDRLDFDLYGGVRVLLRGARSLPIAENAKVSAALEGKVSGLAMQKNANSDSASFDEVVVTAKGVQTMTTNPADNTIQPRRNFNETAFFFPDLRTDKEGNIEFSFTMPEAVTSWKLQTLAHTKDLAFGLSQKEVVTQKELMVQPNAPRFLRQGDHMEFSTKIVNLSDKEMTGQVQLELLDATTNQSVDGWFMNTFPNQFFTVGAGQSESVSFPIQVPFQFNNALVWRITARSGNLSDGEENVLPVLSNKVLVTETLPLAMRGTGTKKFSFDKLLHSGESETLQQHALTVEYTSNPAWYAVQALPYLEDYPYECAEQTWNRYFANALAQKIATSTPRLKEIFQKWKTADTTALLSNLEKNQELKSALLAETPWVLQARSESQQKKNIALLFDMVQMQQQLRKHLDKLRQMQSPNGGFVWFTGGPDDRYITQYIISGIGHLINLGGESEALQPIIAAAIPYLDKQIAEQYNRLVKSKADLNKQQIGYYEIQYLYMRSYFKQYMIDQATQPAHQYYLKQAKQFWMQQPLYLQGMIALALHSSGDQQTPAAILRSIKERAITNEEQGMYWKDNHFGYSWFWWYAPIETQSLLIEAFQKIWTNKEVVDDMKTWLLKNKQTNNWGTTRATAEACYALLLQGSDCLKEQPAVEIKMGTTSISNSNEKAEAGTGYFKRTIEPATIQPGMGNITLDVKNATPISQTGKAPSWGAVYWQYFEDMNKVTAAATPLQLSKKLFIEKNSDRGPVLSPILEGSELEVGNKIKVRIELRVDRDMEYVHMKDMRASALEPVNVLSGYQWQGGLGYYQSTSDASTNFFFNYLRKGTYVFEYPLFVTHAGTFSNGITTIQCMYAPEFSAHSEGVKITVANTASSGK
ncbi:MAG TPA: alpha-2-macroglobulin family protein [Flavisolibacter sp.]|nr:alpha-2-macroglobulin family protein [Flavisolibacter sp.]